MQTLKSTQAMADAMRGATKVGFLAFLNINSAARCSEPCIVMHATTAAIAAVSTAECCMPFVLCCIVASVQQSLRDFCIAQSLSITPWIFADVNLNVLLQAMGAMNKQMNLPALSNIMREFDRQNERMEMTSEMMGDAVDDAFEVRPSVVVSASGFSSMLLCFAHSLQTALLLLLTVDLLLVLLTFLLSLAYDSFVGI